MIAGVVITGGDVMIASNAMQCNAMLCNVI